MGCWESVVIRVIVRSCLSSVTDPARSGKPNCIDVEGREWRTVWQLETWRKIQARIPLISKIFICDVLCCGGWRNMKVRYCDVGRSVWWHLKGWGCIYWQYGPKYENGEWKSRTNRELEEMSKGENIIKWIKGQRISWLGHLERMEEDRMPKKIFTEELEGTRRRGRPRKGWKEEVERDLQVLGVRRWREVVADRKNGRTLFDRPKPTVGCSANGRRGSIYWQQ